MSLLNGCGLFSVNKLGVYDIFENFVYVEWNSVWLVISGFYEICDWLVNLMSI